MQTDQTQVKYHLDNIEISPFSSFRSIIDGLLARLNKGVSSVAIAINPEKIMAARQDENTRAILEQSDVRYADGVGVVKALKHKYGVSVPRLPGCELWEHMMQEAGNRNIPVFLVGAKPHTLEKTTSKLKAQFATPIAGAQHGYFEDESQVIEDIRASGAKIVTVALGSPKQERFIFKCQQAGIQAVFMGVGGTYDVYTGNVKRAPAMWRKLNLEWLYRLLSQPTRWRRQLNLLWFVVLVLLKKI